MYPERENPPLFLEGGMDKIKLTDDRARWIALDGACMRQNPATDVRRRVTGLDGALMLLECARGRSQPIEDASMRPNAFKGVRMRLNAIESVEGAWTR